MRYSQHRPRALGACIVLAAALVGRNTVGAQSVSSLAPAALARIDSAAFAELRSTRTPGSALAIVVGDKVVYANGYGTADTESGAPLSASMIFRLGSTTKMMTSLAILALADRGRLDIDRPIGLYAPAIRAPRLRQVTMRQLLTHTAGILDYTSMSGPHDDAVHNAFIPTLSDTIFFTAPGDVVSYSNLGYTIAGYVASVLTHKPYADVMAELLFAPLGMTHSTLRPIEAMTFPMAQGHTPQPGGSMAVLRPMGDDVRYWAAGSVFTSVHDFSRLLIALLNEGRVDGRQALPAGVVRTALTPQFDVVMAAGASPTRYGFGLMSGSARGVEYIEHSGSRAGYGSVMRLIPAQRVAAVVLGNQSGTALTRTLTTALESVATMAPATATGAPMREPVAAADVALLAGRYRNSAMAGTVELYVEGSTLKARLHKADTSVQELGEVQATGARSYRAGEMAFVATNGQSGASYLVSGLRAMVRLGR